MQVSNQTTGEEPSIDGDVDEVIFKASNRTEPHYDFGADLYGGFQPNQRFQLRSRTNGNQVMYLDRTALLYKPAPFPAVNTDKRAIKMREPKNTNDEFWVYDIETKTIRSVMNSEMAWALDGSADMNLIAEPVNANSLKINYLKETFQVTNGQGCVNWTDKGLRGKPCGPSDGQKWYPWYQFQSAGPWWNRQENV